LIFNSIDPNKIWSSTEVPGQVKYLLGQLQEEATTKAQHLAARKIQ
jgi:hypothetical protein